MIEPTASMIQSPSVDEFLAGLVEELAARFQAGEEVNLETLVVEYPEHEDRLRQLLCYPPCVF